MPLQASCPNCQWKYQVPDHFAGRSVLCKACKTNFTIPVTGDGPLDLAPAPIPAPHQPRPSIQPLPTYSPPDDGPAIPSHWLLKPLFIILGPPDGDFWVFLFLLVGGGLLYFFTGANFFASCTLILVGLAYILAGAIWAARLMTEEGVPLSQLVAIFFGPLIFMLFFYNTLLSNWLVYKRPIFCQVRGIILFLAAFILPSMFVASAPDPYAAPRRPATVSPSAMSRPATQTASSQPAPAFSHPAPATDPAAVRPTMNPVGGT